MGRAITEVFEFTTPTSGSVPRYLGMYLYFGTYQLLLFGNVNYRRRALFASGTQVLSLLTTDASTLWSPRVNPLSGPLDFQMN